MLSINSIQLFLCIVFPRYVLASILRADARRTFIRRETKSPDNLERSTGSYVVCNGMANQMLTHISAISNALEKKKSLVMPDSFVFSEINKYSDDILVDNVQNFVPLDKIFDIEKLRGFFTKKNTESETINLTLQPPSDHEILRCGDPWIDDLRPSNFLNVMDNFAPSPALKDVVDKILNNMGPFARKEGICLHHLNVRDWLKSCNEWGNISDGSWTKSCREQDWRPLGEQLSNRLLKTKQRILYYVGDQEPPKDSLSFHGFTNIYTRSNFLPKDEERELLTSLLGERFDDSLTKQQYTKIYRELWELIDFFVCSEMGSFIGNSVSMWSNLQLAARNGNGMWYDSGSIPLSHVVHIFRVPVVYTYTEHSHLFGKILLKVSISSVRRKLGQSQPIHILYHGNKDKDFLSWLHTHDVFVHFHEPKWTEMIERLRLAGDPSSSHLFAHAGNYLGTWQRIDVPDYIESEYVLFLDADTVVAETFTLGDFGSDITRKVAFSLELEEDEIPFNAGVALMNVPTLRETKKDFLEFIEGGVTIPFSAPSDQGAYLDFYRPDFLDRKFNIKPYFHDMRDGKIMHYHGPKPNEIFNFIIGNKLSPLMTEVIKKGQISGLCEALVAFSKAASEESDLVTMYCAKSFPDDELTRKTCADFFEILSTVKESQTCQNTAMLIHSFYEKQISLLNSNRVVWSIAGQNVVSTAAILLSVSMIAYIILAFSKIKYRGRSSLKVLEITSKQR